tara:strand:+ start:243 stop:911 length:669 start_codon:yes stop_codon:yes gene_type:complete
LKKTKKNIYFSIAIDGDSASGKTTASKFIARHFGFKLLTSGKLYRYLAFRIIKDNKKKLDKTYLIKITKNITFKKLQNNKMMYTDHVTSYASSIAKIKFIRNLLNKFQKKFSKNKKFIIEGRDIGSKILPNADLKLFFKCSQIEKAKRRLIEYNKEKRKITLKEVKKSLKKRDYSDKNRKESPLIFVKGAVLVDTTKLTIKQMEAKLKKIVKEAIKKKYGNL